MSVISLGDSTATRVVEAPDVTVFAAFGPGGTALSALVLVTVTWMACWAAWGSVAAMGRGWSARRGALHGLFGPLGITVLFVRTHHMRVPLKTKVDMVAGSLGDHVTHQGDRLRAVRPVRPVRAAVAPPSPGLVSPPAAPVPPVTTLASPAPALTPARAVRQRRVGFGLSLVAAALFLVSLLTLGLGWVDGLSPSQAAAIHERVGSLDVTQSVGGHEIRIDPTLLPKLDPDDYVKMSGWSLGTVGHMLAALSVAGIVLALLAGWLRRPAAHLTLAVTVTAITTVLATAMALIEWINLRRVPFAGSLPEELHSYLPDSQAGPGFWLYVFMMAMASVAINAAAVRSYRDRYGLAWNAMTEQ